MARNAKFAYFVAMVLGRTQQAAEKCQQQVKSARASPLVLIPIANQPHRFSDSRKMAKNAKCAFCFAMALGHADSRRNTHLQVGAARASPLAFSLIASRPSRFSSLSDSVTHVCDMLYFLEGAVQFNSHLFLSLIGARTLKMPVPYSPPNVGANTRTPSHQPLVFGRKGTDHLP